MKKISVGIPTYNQGKYIEETILSVLNQTVQPYEIVVSDNYCTDNTKEILNKYKDKIKVVRPPRHCSMCENYRFLASQLTGDWYLHIDSDDTFEPNLIETLQKYTDREDVVFMRWGYNLIDENSNCIQKDVRIRSARKIQTFPGNFYEELSGPKNNNAARLVRLDAYRNIGGYNQSLEMDMDWGLWIELASQGSYLYIPKTLSNYRLFPNSPSKGVKRIEHETKDHAYIVNVIQPDIINKYNLDKSLWKMTRLMRAHGRYMFHKQNNVPFDPTIFGVTKKEILNYPKYYDFLIRFRETFLKR